MKKRKSLSLNELEKIVFDIIIQDNQSNRKVNEIIELITNEVNIAYVNGYNEGKQEASDNDQDRWD